MFDPFFSILGYVQEAPYRTGRYEALDPNHAGGSPGRFADSVQNYSGQFLYDKGAAAIPDDGRLAGTALESTYQGVWSALNDGARMLLAGGNPLGAKLLGAADTFSDTLRDYSAMDIGPQRALTMAIGSALPELVIPRFDSMKQTYGDAFSGEMNLWLSFLRQMGIEVGEYSLGYGYEQLLQDRILGSDSPRNRRIGELLLQGKSLEEATALTDRAQYEDFLWGYLENGISGAANTLTSSVAGNAQRLWENGLQNYLAGESIDSIHSVWYNKNKTSETVETIGRSVGAKAKGYEAYNPETEENIPLAEGTRITQPKDHIIAGKGRDRQIDCIDYLLDRYGGKEGEWTKEKGFGFIYNKFGELVRVELHWYQEPEVGKVDMKIKKIDEEGYWG